MFLVEYVPTSGIKWLVDMLFCVNNKLLIKCKCFEVQDSICLMLLHLSDESCSPRLQDQENCGHPPFAI